MRDPVRLAMWSGPRNISTAMMRSWGNRPDTVVVDEPFYAFYLKETGRQHPGSAEILSQSETDVDKIIEQLSGPVPEGKSVFYQKQMTHHLVAGIDRNRLASFTHCFLIRDPAEVIVSYIKKNESPELNDLGFLQQLEIFQWAARQRAAVPAVIDARDVLENPRHILQLLCQAVGVPFDEGMLSWPAGPRRSDGVWARYWYEEVIKSTSFQAYRPPREPVPAHLGEIHQRCRECYDQLYQYRLR